jgi:hypothetical protein
MRRICPRMKKTLHRVRGVMAVVVSLHEMSSFLIAYFNDCYPFIV